MMLMMSVRQRENFWLNRSVLVSDTGRKGRPSVQAGSHYGVAVSLSSPNWIWTDWSYALRHMLRVKLFHVCLTKLWATLNRKAFDFGSIISRREGATYNQLRVLRNAPAHDFVEGARLDSECPYVWRSVLSGGLKNMESVVVPLRCSPCQVLMSYLT